MRVMFCCVLSMFLQWQLLAVTVDIPCPADDQHIDGENTQNRSIADKPANFRVVDVKIVFSSSSSNNIEVLAGIDGLYSQEDGKLSMEEAAWSMGWDTNHYYICFNNLKEKHIFTPADADQDKERTLTLRLRVDSSGETIRSVKFSDHNGEFQFNSLQLNPPPQWLLPAWNTLRVITRGGTGDEKVIARVMKDTSVIIIR